MAWVFISDRAAKRASTIHREFYDGKQVGLTFGRGMGDLSAVDDEDEIARRYAGLLSIKLTARSLASFVRMFHNLYHDISVGDIALFPSEGQLYIGQITSAAYLITDIETETCHARRVKWIAIYMRQRFSAESLKAYPRQLAISRMNDNNRFMGDLMRQLRLDKKLPR